MYLSTFDNNCFVWHNCNVRQRQFCYFFDPVFINEVKSYITILLQRLSPANINSMTLYNFVLSKYLQLHRLSQYICLWLIFFLLGLHRISGFLHTVSGRIFGFVCRISGQKKQKTNKTRTKHIEPFQFVENTSEKAIRNVSFC